MAEYIINHAEIPIIFATQQHVATLLGLASKTPTVKTIVSIDKLEPNVRHVLTKWGKHVGIEIMDFADCKCSFGQVRSHLMTGMPAQSKNSEKSSSSHLWSLRLTPSRASATPAVPLETPKASS